MYDCIVVGAGLVGMCTARELACAGLKVLVLDQHLAGQEASWAGGGILSPLYPWRYPEAVTRLAAWSQAHYPSLVNELISDSGIDSEWQTSGLLILDSHEELQAESWAQKYAVNLHCLTETELYAYEPALAKSFESSVWLPEVSQVRNPRLVKALRKSLEHHHVTLIEELPVTDIKIENGKVTGVTTEGGDFLSDRVVVASGAWTAKLLREVQVSVPIEPVRGQMLMFNARPGLVKRIVLWKEHYLIPRRDGHVLAGSTLEYAGYHKIPTADAHQQLLDQAISIVPALANCPVELQWTGLRPGTQNRGIPYICQVKSVAGLYVNAGHFRNGVVLAPASARLMADLILGKEPTFSPELYQIPGKPSVQSLFTP